MSVLSDSIIVAAVPALITGGMSTVAAIAAIRAHREARSANHAVNGRADDVPSLSDDVTAIRTMVARHLDDHLRMPGRWGRWWRGRPQ